MMRETRSSVRRRTPKSHGADNRGFTLAELLVATVLLSIVMASIYSMFNTTIHGWRLAEGDFQSHQEVRLAFSKFEGEVENLFEKADYLFEGDRHQVTMYVIAEPMDIDAGSGMRIMQVRYRMREGANELVREERLAKASLPDKPRQGQEVSRGRIKLESKSTFTLIKNLVDLEFRYLWVPFTERDRRVPPQWVEPVATDRHAEGWGLPHGIEITMVVANPDNEEEETTFTTRIPVRTNRNKKTVQELAYMLEGR